MHSSTASAARQTIERVAQATEFTKAVIEPLLGVKLAHSPDALPQFNYYEGELASGPFGHIEVREPNPSQDQTWLVVLTVREGVSVPLSELQGDPIGPSATMDVQPRIPPEGVVTYAVRDARQRILFGFTANSQVLQHVAFHRPGS